MLIGVDAGALAVAAAAADRAADLVATVRLDEFAASIGAAMPGSRSAEVAIRLATLCSDTTTGLVRDLSGHADALRTASAGYAETEREVAASIWHDDSAA